MTNVVADLSGMVFSQGSPKFVQQWAWTRQNRIDDIEDNRLECYSPVKANDGRFDTIIDPVNKQAGQLGRIIFIRNDEASHRFDIHKTANQSLIGEAWYENV